MNIMPKACNLMITVIGLAGSSAISAEELKDPWTRDEDISKTRIEVDYNADGSGLWTYDYTIHAPEANLGSIGDFSIHLRCDATFDNSEIVPQPKPDDEGFAGQYNLKPITPTAVRADWGAAGRYGFGRENLVFWVTNILPGKTAGKLTLISVAEPGLRRYELIPHMDTAGYDYSDGPDENLPSTHDFTVQGVIAAPGCPGEVPPVEQPSFPGTLQGAESENLNELLSYKAPLKDRMWLDEDSSHASLTIVYRQDLDPKTFKTQPGWAKRHFNPKPGTEETVKIPLKTDRLRLFLEAHRQKAEKPPSGSDEAPPTHAHKDRDEFEFRLPGYQAKQEKQQKGKQNGQ